ncbi:MAG: hypothetical protein IKG21_08840 [Atopobiaceae bacterium]|nr:hypothetical protein [Atopobiaceae bacterium]
MGMKVARAYEATIAGLVSFTYSGAFHEMDESKSHAASDIVSKRQFAIQDKSHRIVVSVTWNEAGRFIGKFATARDTNHGLEKHMRKTLRNERYTFQGHYERKVAGQIATCFSYTHEVAGKLQMCDVVTIKCGRTFLNFCCNFDSGTEERARRVFDDILESVEEV